MTSRTGQDEYFVGLLRELCALPEETGWVEFKVDNSNPQDIGEYVSALSNSAALCGKSHAYLVWGVDNSTHDVVGTNFKPTQAKKGNERLENWLLHLVKPRIRFRFLEFEVEGKQVSLIEIPRAAHHPVRFSGTEYIRIGSYKKKLKDFPEEERELWRVFDTTPFERQPAAAGLTSGEVLGLLDYPSYFSLLKMPLPETRDIILERLADDHMIEGCHGKWNILNLGAILFATDLSEFQHLARKAVRVIQNEGESRIATTREYQGQKGYAAGFEGLMGFLKAILPESEEIGSAFRESVPVFPEVAIRELVANAIIHQDFTMTGAGPMVEVFDRRVEITNPGEPLMETQRFLDTPPRSRNEDLASFLRRVSICEERGSGVDKVVFQTEHYHLPAPLFEVVEGQTRAVLFAHKPFSEMDKADKIRACYLHACLQYVERKQMTNKTLKDRFNLSSGNSSQISRIITDAVNGGFIKPYDPESASKKFARYIPFWA